MTSLVPVPAPHPDDTPASYTLMPGHYVLNLDPTQPEIRQAVAIARLLRDTLAVGPTRQCWLARVAN